MHAAIQRARAEIERPAAEFQRDLACDHLDQLSERAWSIIVDPGPLVSSGRVMAVDGRPVLDRRVIVEALRLLIQIDERRAGVERRGPCCPYAEPGRGLRQTMARLSGPAATRWASHIAQITTTRTTRP